MAEISSRKGESLLWLSSWVCDFVSVTENRLWQVYCLLLVVVLLPVPVASVHTHTCFQGHLGSFEMGRVCQWGSCIGILFLSAPICHPPSLMFRRCFVSNWMTNCCVCGLRGHESGVPTMRWKGIIGTTIAVSLLCFTPLDSAVYTVLTRETDTGTSVRLGLWRHKPHTPTDVCLGGRLLGSSASTTVPKAGQAGVNRRRPCSAHHRKSNEAASWSCFFTRKASPLTDQ